MSLTEQLKNCGKKYILVTKNVSNKKYFTHFVNSVEEAAAIIYRGNKGRFEWIFTPAQVLETSEEILTRLDKGRNSFIRVWLDGNTNVNVLPTKYKLQTEMRSTVERDIQRNLNSSKTFMANYCPISKEEHDFLSLNSRIVSTCRTIEDDLKAQFLDDMKKYLMASAEKAHLSREEFLEYSVSIVGVN
jgi:hypothetical protein